MKKIRLGKTDIMVNKNGFGALPIQRISYEESDLLLKKAFQQGIDFYDTARMYSDSEEKIARALRDKRHQIIIASKTMAKNTTDFWEDLHTSLKNLKTDYIDIYQFHTPGFCPIPEDGSDLYEAMVEAKRQGKIRFIGITNHRLAVAQEALKSGLYDTLQFPFSYLADQREIDLVHQCKEKDVGFIAMKALAGGLIHHSDAAYAYIDQFDHVLPIWGIQKERELEEFLQYQKASPVLNDRIESIIESDREELMGDFCRACGYCLPCPVDIDIPQCARMSLLLRRAPKSMTSTDEWKRKMLMIEQCTQCNQCKEKCPYELNTPELLRKNLEVYQTY